MLQTIDSPRERQLLSIGFLMGLAVLLANDHFLKERFPGFLTGKLSDFAGLFIFPMFFCSFFPKLKRPLYVLTSFLFIIWKSSLANIPIGLANQVLPFRINRVIDYSDYLALLVLPISYCYRPKQIIARHWVPIMKFFICCVALFGFLATAGTVGNIKTYPYNYSKRQILVSVTSLLRNYPELDVPFEYAALTKGHFNGPPNDKLLNDMNADSVNFHFLISSVDDRIVWVSFMRANENWNANSCELILRGVSDSGGRWRYDDDLSSWERERIIERFESVVLRKLKEELLEKYGH